MEVSVRGHTLAPVWQPTNDRLPNVDAPLATLFHTLSVDDILVVVRCALLGGRLLFVSESQSMLVLAAL